LGAGAGGSYFATADVPSGDTRGAFVKLPGAILVSEFEPVKIHSYLSTTDGLQVNTQMIEGLTAVSRPAVVAWRHAQCFQAVP
jgi:hypothetical protein